MAPCRNVLRRHTIPVASSLFWDEETEDYVRHRERRYLGAVGAEPEHARLVLHDVDLVALEPDPKSRSGASRFVSYSVDAAHVLVVIAWRDDDGDLHLVNAWRATGVELRIYEQQED